MYTITKQNLWIDISVCLAPLLSTPPASHDTIPYHSAWVQLLRFRFTRPVVHACWDPMDQEGLHGTRRLRDASKINWGHVVASVRDL